MLNVLEVFTAANGSIHESSFERMLRDFPIFAPHRWEAVETDGYEFATVTRVDACATMVPLESSLRLGFVYDAGGRHVLELLGRPNEAPIVLMDGEELYDVEVTYTPIRRGQVRKVMIQVRHQDAEEWRKYRFTVRVSD